MKIKKIFLLCIATSLMISEGCKKVPPSPPLPKPSQQCVDFESPLTLGAKYGSSTGNLRGSIIFTVNSIKVSVHDFIYVSGNSTFGNATIAKPPFLFGISQTINTNNINLGFDFSSSGFIPQEVVFEFLDQGGIQNLSVNGSQFYVGKLANVSGPINGINVVVSISQVPGASACIGKVVLRGPAIRELIVGGQEFWLDNVCVVQ
jgi:hypothetical protein